MKKSVLGFLLGLMAAIPNLFAQTGPAFSCDSSVYQVQGTRLRVLDPTTGVYANIGAANSNTYNATGFNSLDNYIYGSEKNTNALIRVHADGTVVPIFNLGFTSNAGDVDNSNQLWLKRSSTLYSAVDLATGVITDHQLTGTAVNADDVVFMSINGVNYLLSIRNDQMMIANLDTGISRLVAVAGLAVAGNRFGALWTDADERFWAFNNDNGKIYEILDYLGTPTAVERVQAAPSGSNDGMSCRNTTFPDIGLISELGLAKTAGVPSLNSDGSFDVAYTLIIENTGNQLIDNLQLSDQLNTADQLGTAFTPSIAADTAGGVITAPSLLMVNTSGDSVAPSLNPVFDGGGNANLLLGSDGELAPGDQLTITFSVRVDANAANAPNLLQNIATASGDNPTSDRVSDQSDNGIDPEANPGEDTGTPTPVTAPVTAPELGVAKQAGTPTLNEDGSFDVEFTLVLKNTGNLIIDKLQLIDQLNVTDQLGAAFTPSTAADNTGGVIIAPELTLTNTSGDSITPTINPNFDGGNNANMFVGSDGELAPDDEIEVSFSVRINPNAFNAPDPLQNIATASGDDPSGDSVSDQSDNGSDPESNPGENTGTPTQIVPPATAPELGVAKQVGSPTLNDNGTFDVEFTLVVENTGNVAIDNLQFADQLDTTEQLGSAFIPSTAADTANGVIVAPALTLINSSGNSVAPSLDAAFDGGSNANFLLGTDGKLMPGDQLEITFSVRIDPNATNAPDPLQNSATVSGDDPADNSVSDVSDAGIDPQINPGEAVGTPTPIVPPATEPELGFAKQAGTPTLNVDGSFDIDFTLIFGNTGDVVLHNLQLVDQLNALDQLGSAFIPSTASNATGGVIAAPTITLTNTSGSSIAPSLDAVFDGGSNANLFVGTDGELAPGDKIEVTFGVRIDTNVVNAPLLLQNSATVSGDDPADNSVSDVSDNGTDPMVNPGEDTGAPTPVVPPATEPQLGVAKQAGTPTLKNDGTFDIDFTLILENTGNVVIDNLQLADQLDAADQLGSAYAPSTVSDASSGIIVAPALTLINTSSHSSAPSLDAAFDGGINANLFVGTDGELAPGDQIEITFSVRINPNATNAPNPLQNSATVSGEDPSDNTVSDRSDSGADPMVNPGEDIGTPTPIVPPASGPELGVAKQASTLTLNTDGTFDIDFTLILENTGDVVIDNLQLIDQLDAVDQLGSAYIPSTAADTTNGVIVAPTLILTNTSGNSIAPSLDAAFDGGSNANLFIGSNGELAPGDQIEVVFSVRVNPNATNAPSLLQNSAIVSGDDPSDAAVTDVSDTGSNPQTNPGETTGTPTPIVPPASEAQLGAAKQAGTPTLNADGSFDIGFTLTLENTGDVVIDSLQLIDQLDAVDQLGSTFMPSTAANASSGIIVAPALTLINTSGNSIAPSIEPAFNGGSNPHLFAGTDGELAPGDQIEVTFSVRINPNAANAPDPLINSATVSGDDPADNNVSDVSDSGANPQANPGESTGTPTTIVPPTSEPELGVAKQAGIPMLNNDGTFDIDFTVLLENTGNVVIGNLQLVDQLDAADQLGSAFTSSTAADTDNGVIVAPTLILTNTSGNSIAPSVDTAFDGGSNANLLLGTDGELAPGDQVEVAFTVRINPNAVNAPNLLQNSATGSGDDPADNNASDVSDTGSNPQANPGETTGTPTPITPPTTEPQLGVAKQAGTPILNADGTFDIDFTLVLENTGNVVLDNLQLVDQLDATDQLGSAFTPSAASNAAGGLIKAPTVTLTNISGNSVLPSLDIAYDGGGNAKLFSGADGELAPGDQIEVAFTVRINANANNAPDPLQNSATVSGDDPTDNTVSDISDSGTNPTANPGEDVGMPTPISLPTTNPSLEITDVADASAVSGVPQVGDVIEYIYTVTNTGDVVLTNIIVTDPNADSNSINYSSNSDGDGDNDIDQLAPGETVTVTAQHTVTQADIDAAIVVSHATATGSDPATNEVSDLSDDGIDIDGNNVDDPTETPLAAATGAQLSVIKTSTKLNVRRGEIIPYTIQIENLETSAVNNMAIVDRLPAGFRYVDSSATLDAIDATDACTEFSVNQELRCTGVNFDAEQKRSLSLLLVAGAGVTEGEYINYAWVENTALTEVASNTGSATVNITPDPIFDCSDIIGKVFDDKNYDGYQNKGEEALPRVRLATVRGLRVTTDEHGRYHITCAALPNAERGSNFIIKLDERSLPSGYRITTENPRVVRVTRGKIEEADFGAAIHRVVRLDVNASVYQADSTSLALGYQQHINQLIEQLESKASVLRLSYIASGESKALIDRRIKVLRKIIMQQWKKTGCCYRLLIETEITPAQSKQ